LKAVQNLRILSHRLIATCTFAGVISGCALLPQPDVHPPTESLPAGFPPLEGSGVEYRIEAARLTIHTYRAGWLSFLAHNHVMETERLGGALRLAEPVQASRAVLYFRPWDLILDDPDARAAAGAGFESTRTPAEVAATRTRMLGPGGFDSNLHPFVVVEVRPLNAEQVELEINVRGAIHSVTIPLDWRTHGQTLTAAADFELSQRALGIRPYSAFAGAIAVADRTRVQLELSARPAEAL
jgi:hypothetical protein